MRFDHRYCLIREKYPDGDIGNLGDSCAETCRAWVLGDERGSLSAFVSPDGFLRHPDLAGVHDWDERDFSNDQLLPMIFACKLLGLRRKYNSGPFIKGTWTLISLGCWAAICDNHWLLNFANLCQGILFKFKWRITDNWGIERSLGKVQDWLNFRITYEYLVRRGYDATINQPNEKCIAAITTYYLGGQDWEPNSDWIVRLYQGKMK